MSSLPPMHEVLSSFVDHCNDLIKLLKTYNPNQSYPMKMSAALSASPSRVLAETSKIVVGLRGVIDTWDEEYLINYANTASNNIQSLNISTPMMDDSDIQNIIQKLINIYKFMDPLEKDHIRVSIQDLLGICSMAEIHKLNKLNKLNKY